MGSMSFHQSEHDILMAFLRSLIGYGVRYHDQRCRIVEVLDQGPALVLEACHHDKEIQPDQLGEAHRRVPRTFTLPLIDRHGTLLNPAVSALDLPGLDKALPASLQPG